MSKLLQNGRKIPWQVTTWWQLPLGSLKQFISTRASHTDKLFYFNWEKFLFPPCWIILTVVSPIHCSEWDKTKCGWELHPSYFPGESERVCLGWKHRDQSYWVWGGQRQGPRYKNQTLDYQCFSPILANPRNLVLGWKSQIAIPFLGTRLCLAITSCLLFLLPNILTSLVLTYSSRQSMAEGTLTITPAGRKSPRPLNSTLGQNASENAAFPCRKSIIRNLI